MALFLAGSAEAQAQQAAPGGAAPSARAERAAPPAKAQPRPANDPAKMKWLLGAWEAQSAKLKTLDVHIYRVDKDLKWRDEAHFDGRALFKSNNLAYLDFWKLKLAPGAQGKLAPVKDPKNPKEWVKEHTETIVCGKDAVWQYLWDGRQIFIFPLAKGERQRALDEGPLPFLFNMKAKDAEARYEMSFQGENKEYYLVKVLPKLQEDKESFKVAFLYLEKKFLLPVQIALISPDGRSTREFTLEGHRPNAEIDDKYFQGGVFKGWTVQRNPAPEGPRQGDAGARPGAAGGTIRR
jgi:TIGR03009 family protein